MKTIETLRITLDGPLEAIPEAVAAMTQALVGQTFNGVRVEAITPRLPAGIFIEVDGQRLLCCPYCEGLVDDGDYYFEDICNRRAVNGQVVVNGTVTVEIEGYYETDGCDEGGENPRIMCGGCDKEFTIPPEVEQEFV